MQQITMVAILFIHCMVLAKPCQAQGLETQPARVPETFKLQSQTLFLRGGVDEQASPLNVLQRKQVNPLGSAQSPILAPTLKELRGELSKANLKATVDDGDYLFPPALMPQRPALAPIRGFTMKAAPATQLDPEVDREVRNEVLKAGNRANLGFAIPIFKQEPIRFGGVPRPVGPKAIDAGVEAELRGELLKAKNTAQPTVELDLQGQLRHSKAIVDRQMVEAHTQLRSVLRAIKPNAELLGRLLPYSEQIGWDAWYQRIGSLSEPRLLKCLAARQNPSGSNTLEITVTSKQTLTARVVRASNPGFDAATVQAYRLLNGRAELKFPTGSRRQQVQFLVDNDRELSGSVSDVITTPCVGDRECHN